MSILRGQIYCGLDEGLARTKFGLESSLDLG